MLGRFRPLLCSLPVPAELAQTKPKSRNLQPWSPRTHSVSAQSFLLQATTCTPPINSIKSNN
jgi:hypothetical protein